jgi:5'-3' exonuclease
MKVYLVDGTYELFRHYYALPHHVNKQGKEVAASRGVTGSMLSLLEGGATHIAVATDYVIESFRNALWEDYKDGSGIEPDLLSQFRLLEDSLNSLGLIVWPMIDFEADDALAAGAALYASDHRVEQVIICTPDKDLAQCVRDDRVIQFDRRRKSLINRPAVIQKFGVPPESIPDYLALVGDSADGYPGLPGWGAKSAAAILSRYGHLEDIPQSFRDWKVSIPGAMRLGAIFAEQRERAFLFRRLATLVTEAPVNKKVDDLQWSGPRPEFEAICERLEAPILVNRAKSLSNQRKN